jgi:ribosomal protein L23
MLEYHKIIDRPIVTEESQILRENGNHYVFRVNPKANKRQIKEAIEEMFRKEESEGCVGEYHELSRERCAGRLATRSVYRKACTLEKGDCYVAQGRCNRTDLTENK